VVLSYSIYLLNKYTRIFPPPNIETEKAWKGYVINNIESSISAATYWELGVLYPLFIASIGIFAMELERDREIYLSVVGTSLFLGAMFWCADWTIRNAKKCYEEVTGSKHIKFFIYLRTRP